MLLEIIQFHRDTSADVRKFVLGESLKRYTFSGPPAYKLKLLLRIL